MTLETMCVLNVSQSVVKKSTGCLLITLRSKEKEEREFEVMSKQ